MKNGAVGLIAGSGSLPVCFLKKANEKKIKTLVFEITGDENPEAVKLASKSLKVKITALSSVIAECKKEGVGSILMLGYLQHTNIFKRIAFDLRTIKIIARAKDRRASSILNEVVRELESEGIKVLPSTYLMEDALAPKGVCGKRRPSVKEKAEAVFAFKMAKSLASLDIGQSVIVKNTSVTAAESLEGTDDCIARGAKIGGKGFILAKAAGPKRDMRFDVPVIGIKTIETVIRHKGSGIVVEAGKTFLLDREETIKKADRHGIFIIGV